MRVIIEEMSNKQKDDNIRKIEIDGNIVDIEANPLACANEFNIFLYCLSADILVVGNGE